MGFIFGGGDQETTTKTELPRFVRDFSEEAFNRARGIADQPYQGYTGTRVAGPTASQQMANQQAQQQFQTPLEMVQAGFDRAQTLSSKGLQDSPIAREGMKWIEQGADFANRAGNAQWTQQSADRYMNPFLQGALDPVLRRINEEAQQNAIGTRAGQIMSGGEGAFGDARTGVLEGQLEEARLRGIGDTMASGYRDAYDRALAEWGNTQNRRLAAGGLLGNLGNTQIGQWQAQQDRAMRGADLMGVQGGRYAATTAQGIQDLLATGGTQQGTQQRIQDARYQDFLEERDWDQRGLDAYIRALSGVPFESSSTSSGNTGPSVAQQALGLGIAGAGLWNLFS